MTYYWFALRNKKFHYYNRFYLLSASIISLILPLFNFDWFLIEEPVIYGSSEVLQFVLPIATSTSTNDFEWMDFIMMGSFLITMALLITLGIQIYRIQILKRKSEVTPMDGFDFVHTKEENAPFSFLNNLFWKETISLQDEGGQQIFKHEITHIQQKHTWDRIYCQFVASICWMNPMNWIIQKELMTIHEFIADEEAVGNENVEIFAKMLLQTHYGNHFLNPTHQFFYSSIKRRIMMLTTSKNIKYSYARRLMILPILVIAVGLVSIKVNATERIINGLNKMDEVVVHNGVSDIKFDSIPKEKLVKNSLARKSKLKKSLNAAAAITKLVAPLESSLVILDGAFVMLDKINQLDPDKIKSLNVLDTKTSIKKYGSKGKYGAIEVESRPAIKKIIMMRAPNNQSGEQVNPLYVLNRLAVESIAFDSLKPSDIKAINIKKGEEAIKMFGEKGKNGVIFITTKWQ
jgi:hypothetical protein